MTLTQACTALYEQSLDGYINGEKFTLSRFLNQVRSAMHRPDVPGYVPPRVYRVEVALPDGWWLCTIDQYADRPDGYDYWIPDTREQEAAEWARFTHKAEG